MMWAFFEAALNVASLVFLAWLVFKACKFVYWEVTSKKTFRQQQEDLIAKMAAEQEEVINKKRE